MTITDLYLILYNTACCAGWAAVWFLGVQSLAQGTALDQVYGATPELGPLLYYVQMAAIMEIVHAAIGLVRSPVMVTFMQVSSRIVALVAIDQSMAAQSESYFHTITTFYTIPQLTNTFVSLFMLQLSGALPS